MEKIGAVSPPRRLGRSAGLTQIIEATGPAITNFMLSLRHPYNRLVAESKGYFHDA